MALDERHLDQMLGNPWHYASPPTCPECGYNLVGTGGNRCPECGKTFVRSVVAEEARKYESEIRRMSNMNDVARAGLIFAAVAGAFLLLGVLRPTLGGLGRFVAVVCAVPAIAMGLNVFRVKRLPPWMQEHLPFKPNYGLGVGSALAGVVELVLAVVAS